MKNIFESTEPIEDWALKHFSTLYGEVAAILCSDKQDSDDTMEAFREAMREWVKQQQEMQQCETAAGEGMKMLEEMEPIDLKGMGLAEKKARGLV